MIVLDRWWRIVWPRVAVEWLTLLALMTAGMHVRGLKAMRDERNGLLGAWLLAWPPAGRVEFWRVGGSAARRRGCLQLRRASRL